MSVFGIGVKFCESATLASRFVGACDEAYSFIRVMQCSLLVYSQGAVFWSLNFAWKCKR